MPRGLEEYRASFEASLREAPQDEEFFSMLSKDYLMMRSEPAQPGRVSKHARRLTQCILAQPRSAFRLDLRPVRAPLTG
jgi:hypothetical protein